MKTPHIVQRALGRFELMSCNPKRRAYSQSNGSTKLTPPTSNAKKARRGTLLVLSIALALAAQVGNVEASETAAKVRDVAEKVSGIAGLGGLVPIAEVFVPSVIVSFFARLVSEVADYVDEVADPPPPPQPPRIDPPPRLSSLSLVNVDMNTGDLVPTMTPASELPPGSVVALLGNDFNESLSKNVVLFGVTAARVVGLVELDGGLQALLVNVPLLRKTEEHVTHPVDAPIRVVVNRERSNPLPFRIGKLIDAGDPGQATNAFLDKYRQFLSRVAATDWKKVAAAESQNEGVQFDEFDCAVVASLGSQLVHSSNAAISSLDQSRKSVSSQEDLRVLDSVIKASPLEALLDAALKIPLGHDYPGDEVSVKQKHPPACGHHH